MAVDENWDINPKLPAELEASLSELLFESGEKLSIIANSKGKAKMYILLKDNKKYCEERNYREILSYIVGMKRGYMLHKGKGQKIMEKETPSIQERTKKKLPWE